MNVMDLSESQEIKKWTLCMFFSLTCLLMQTHLFDFCIRVSSGVRDSVSHTAQPDDPSQTAEPPVLLDLPENRSTIPWVQNHSQTKYFHHSNPSGQERRVCLDFTIALTPDPAILWQISKWHKLQTQFLNLSKQALVSSAHTSPFASSRRTCTTGRFSLTKVSNIFLSEGPANKLWMKIFVNKVSASSSSQKKLCRCNCSIISKPATSEC